MGYIKKDTIDKIHETARIEEVINDFVELKQAGVNLKGFSPFVEEKTPSFVVSKAKQIYKDFSSGKGGTVVNFLMESQQMSYPEALEYLAKKYNIEVEYERSEFTEAQKQTLEKKESLRPVLESVFSLYRNAFNNLPNDHAAKQEVFCRREYSSDDVIEWGIGFAPENFIYDKLDKSGRLQQGSDLGLIKEGAYGNKYDQYSNRVIYPIHNDKGLLVGFAGRALDTSKKAKWINPDVNDKNVLYQKSYTWFGMHKAKRAIVQHREAFIVEGYNDVIAFHKLGLQNTIAPCGTSVPDSLWKQLRKYSDKVVFCMDPDKAGNNAVLKQIPTCIALGFRVDVIELPALDPDDFSRVYKKSFEIHKFSLYDLFNAKLEEKGRTIRMRVDGFKMYMESMLVGDAISVAMAAKNICRTLAYIKEDSILPIYKKWLGSEAKLPAKEIDKWVKEFQNEIKETEEKNQPQNNWDIELPKSVTTPLKDLIDDIRTYGMFQSDNQIWAGDSAFYSISNFSIDILQHMNDEKFPKKLLRIKNIFKKEVIFDTNSENLNSLNSFYNTVTGQGNFRFDGDNRQLKTLIHYLMDKMGDGKKIDVLGWQPDGEFYTSNNMAQSDIGEDIPIDENGVIVYKGVHYYIPSANKIYKNAVNKYNAQKRYKTIYNDTDFNLLLSEIKSVHREHSITALLFAISSLFQDIVVKELESFPLLFLYGPGSSGKDELARIVQSFTGVPQSPINLEGGASTMKAQIREFAQFRNGISQLSEYKRGDIKLDGMLKGLWDRNGYKRGNLESLVSSEEIPIESSVILTGNEYPQPEALITRLLWNEMIKNEFTEEEMERFDKLKDKVGKGMSGYAFDLMRNRKMVEESFSKRQREWKVTINQHIPGARGRMVTNYSILATFYTLFKDLVMFPFSQVDMLDYFKSCIDQQLTKINNSSITNRFWEMFVMSLRGSRDERLQVNQVVSVESNFIYFNWKHTYGKLQRMWYAHYQEAAPSNSSLLESLKKAGVVVDTLKSHTFSPGRIENGGIKTSAIKVDLDKLEEELRNDIVGSIMFQVSQHERENGTLNMFPPATPEENKMIGESEKPPF